MHNSSRESSETEHDIGKENGIDLLGHCAEVFCTSNGSLIYCCTLCDAEDIADEVSFKNHLFNNHQNYTSIGKMSALATINNKPDNTIDEEAEAESDDNDDEAHDNDDEAHNNDDDFHDNDDEVHDNDDEADDNDYESDDGYSCQEIRTSPIPNSFDNNQPDEQNDINDQTSTSKQTLKNKIVEYEITPAVDLLPIADDNDASSMDVVESENATEETKVEFELVEVAPPCLIEDDENKKKRKQTVPRTKIDPNARRFKCSICDLAFKEAYNMRSHMRRHQEEKLFVCSQTECAKRFHTKSELDTHERRHRGEFPFMCAQCGRRFITAGDFNKHTKRHLNIRPHKCDKCNKSFFDTSQLKYHYVVHTRERPHTCLTCSATFARRKSLVTHMKIHANKREYVCYICQAAFNQSPALFLHMRKHGVKLNQNLATA